MGYRKLRDPKCKKTKKRGQPYPNLNRVDRNRLLQSLTEDKQKTTNNVEKKNNSSADQREKEFRSSSTRINPKSIKPLNEHLREYLPAIIRFTTNEWLTRWPAGAGMQRFRKDLAVRMKTFKHGGPTPGVKLRQNVIKSIVGEMARNNLIELWKNGRGVIQLKPPSNSPTPDDNKQSPNVRERGGNGEIKQWHGYSNTPQQRGIEQIEK